jgi:hypothetical protein
MWAGTAIVGERENHNHNNVPSVTLVVSYYPSCTGNAILRRQRGLVLAPLGACGVTRGRSAPECAHGEEGGGACRAEWEGRASCCTANS